MDNAKKIGTAIIKDFNMVEKPQFLSYIQAGWQINLSIAIDYTASNSDPNLPYSLHYLNGVS